ncbi:MAG: hypothetical protein NTV63_03500 [Candidatus Woesearchaeota archaeon]|nr:hypothetical protein [Candidatus Woesearchaeota archaeon]
MKSLKNKIILGALIVGIGAFCPTQAISQVNLEDKVSTAVVSQESAEPLYRNTNPTTNSIIIIGEPVEQKEVELKSITGIIKAIDEDEIPILSSMMTVLYNASTKSMEPTYIIESGSFQFENMRIYSETDKKTYRVVFPGPSNYQVGDKVNFKYEPKTTLSFNELVDQYHNGSMVNSPLQRGYFNLDGLIRRQGE